MIAVSITVTGHAPMLARRTLVKAGQWSTAVDIETAVGRIREVARLANWAVRMVSLVVVRSSTLSDDDDDTEPVEQTRN